MEEAEIKRLLKGTVIEGTGLPVMVCQICGAEVAGRKERRIHQKLCMADRARKNQAIRDFLRNNPEIAKQIAERQGMVKKTEEVENVTK